MLLDFLFEIFGHANNVCHYLFRFFKHMGIDPLQNKPDSACHHQKGVIDVSRTIPLYLIRSRSKVKCL